MTEKNKGMLEMFICASLWSIAGLFIKLINWNPLVIAGMRSLISAATVGVFILITKKKLIFNKRILKYAIIFPAIFFCFVGANKLTTAANTIVLEYTSPIFTMVFSAIFLKKKFRNNDVIAAFATLLGIALCFLDQISGNGHMLGNIVAIGAGAGMAAMYIIMAECTDEERFSVQFIGHIITAIIGLAFIPFTVNDFTAISWVNIFVLGVVQLGIPYILLGLSANTCPPLAMCLISAVEPLLNPIWVAIFDGEMPGMFAVLGGIVVIATVTIWTILDKRKESTE